MQQNATKWMFKAPHGNEAGSISQCDGEKREGQAGWGEAHRERKQDDGQDLSAKQQRSHWSNHAGRGEPFGGVPAQTAPDFTVRMVHPAGGEISRIKKIGDKTGTTKCAR